MLNRRVLGVATSALSILAGGLYTFRAFGPTESEVVLWGQFSLLGGALAWLAGLPRFSSPQWRLPAMIGFGTLAAAQLPPIALWFLFHGRSIGDGTPPSWFTAHWAFALPHALLLLTSGFAAVARRS